MMRPITPLPLRRWPLLALIALALLSAAALARPAPALAVTGTPTPTLTPGAGNYVVQYGDTLSSIAKRFGVTVAALKSANNLTSDAIYAGEILRIPAPTPLTPTRTATPLPAGSFHYTVQAGDQLLALARRFGVTTSAIRSANRLTSDTLFAGQVLVIPAPFPTATLAPGAQFYVVQPGDQLLRIARRFGITLSALKAANGLASDTLQPGQVLTIPGPTATPTPSRTPTALPTNYVAYVVERGNRLAQIAAMYGVTVEAIKTANGLRSDTIVPGWTLAIPNPATRPVPYTVQRGDTLTGLAERFGTTAETIKIVNRMRDDTIYAGLTLIIPMK
jgi:LysM repeat protein